MTAEYGYVWFLPPWFTDRWWDTDKHNAAFPKEKVPCTSAEMLSAIQGHFILTTAFLGEENSRIVGNCTVGNWLEAYLEHLQALVSISRHCISVTYLCHFISAGSAVHRSWSNTVFVSVCVCVWMLTRVTQIITTPHRDL